MNQLIIDCRTEGANEGIRRIRRLKGTASIEGPFPYHIDTTYSQLVYCGDKSERGMDDWLYSTRFDKFEWVGVVDNTGDGK